MKARLSRRNRSAIARFRAGVAPIKLELSRYTNTPINDRKCQHCGVVEDEVHVILKCPIYDSIRAELMLAITSMIAE